MKLATNVKLIQTVVNQTLAYCLLKIEQSRPVRDLFDKNAVHTLRPACGDLIACHSE